MSSDNRIPLAALFLGLGGLVPFVTCAGLIVTGLKLVFIPDPVAGIVTYAAIILSFLGGVRWGFALRMVDNGLQARAFVLAVGPSIAGWLLLLTPAPMALSAMPVIFIMLLLADRGLSRIGAPSWYFQLRIVLTVVAVLSLMTGVIGLSV
jgi:Protein of unknown function (DUF3429)